MVEGVSGTALWMIMAALVVLMLGPAVLADLSRRVRDDRISEEAMKDIDRRKDHTDHTP